MTSRVFAIGFGAAGLAAILSGCGTDDGGGLPTGTAGSGNPAAGSGNPTAGSTGTGASTGMGGSGGGTTGTSGAAPGGSGGASVGGSAGASAGGSAGAGGGAPPGDITKVWKSDGCGKAPPAEGMASMGTMGTKDADCASKLMGEARCGAWGQESCTWTQFNDSDPSCKQPLQRSHFLDLPADYDNNRAYPLVLLGPGCGGNAQAIYGYNENAGNNIIRVGVAPAHPRVVGHGTNPGEGCFDDKEGDDSVDWVHYEALYDKLNQEVCFDRNRVFAGGNSSGAWWSNELGCKYAGDASRPIRGIIPNTGGLPDQPQYKPTCTTKPMSGLWIHEINDTTNGFAGNKYAIARAMMVNGCTMGNSYDNATLEDYPVPGRPAGECKKIAGCPELHPLVVCALNGNGHGSHDETVNPTAATYLQSFLKAPFLTP